MLVLNIKSNPMKSKGAHGMTTPENSKVTILEEKVVNIPKAKRAKEHPPVIITEAPPPPAPPKHPVDDMAVMAMLNAMARVIGARLVLLLALLGAFVLSLMAVLQPDGMRLLAAAAYCLPVFVLTFFKWR